MITEECLNTLVEVSKAAAQEQDAAAITQLQLEDVICTLSQLLESVNGTEPIAASGQRQVLLCLRVLRNVCAAGEAVAAALAAGGVIQVVCMLLDRLAIGGFPLDWEVPQACSQLLANGTQASRAFACSAWRHLFPRQFSLLAHIHAGATQAATSLALLACCKQVAGAAEALAGPGGSDILISILCGSHRQQRAEHDNNVLGLLMCHLCLACGLLPRVWLSLGNVAPESAAAEPTLARTLLLQELCSEAQVDTPGVVPAGDASSGTPFDAAPSMRFVVDLVAQLASCSKQAPPSAGLQQVLQDALQLVRDVAGRDDDGRSLAAGQPLVDALLHAGIVPLLLAMLAALKPLQHARDSLGSTRQVQELAPALMQRLKQLPWDAPYRGYRTDVLSALANLAHRRAQVAANVAELQGVVLVLGQCQPDPDSPLAREWALWAIRNLCEGSEQAQAAIRELQVCSTADSEEMRRMGMRLELDATTGKPRVVRHSTI